MCDQCKVMKIYKSQASRNFRRWNFHSLISDCKDYLINRLANHLHMQADISTHQDQVNPKRNGKKIFDFGCIAVHRCVGGVVVHRAKPTVK